MNQFDQTSERIYLRVFSHLCPLICVKSHTHTDMKNTTIVHNFIQLRQNPKHEYKYIYI